MSSEKSAEESDLFAQGTFSRSKTYGLRIRAQYGLLGASWNSLSLLLNRKSTYIFKEIMVVTGRNAQFNIKATPETIARFTALADQNGWVFGEALDRALDALESLPSAGSSIARRGAGQKLADPVILIVQSRQKPDPLAARRFASPCDVPAGPCRWAHEAPKLVAGNSDRKFVEQRELPTSQ
jgi:hypothetical protein